jgi:hypothetical protein
VTITAQGRELVYHDGFAYLYVRRMESDDDGPTRMLIELHRGDAVSHWEFKRQAHKGGKRVWELVRPSTRRYIYYEDSESFAELPITMSQIVKVYQERAVVRVILGE